MLKQICLVIVVTSATFGCSDPLAVDDITADTLVINGVTASAKIIAATGIAELNLNNHSDSVRTLQFGGCSLRLLIFESGRQTPRYDSMTGGCDDYLQIVTLNPGETATVTRVVALPGLLSEYTGATGVVKLIVNNANAGEIRAPILGP
jgi:hypothetical protein